MADDRKKDRHKNTDARKKDRHKSKADRHKNKSRADRHKKMPSPPWAGGFIAVDGEGWDGKYTVLAMSGQKPAVNREGLSSLDCLHYLTSHRIGKNAVVGFGLSYDFENILRDIPDRDYLTLTEDTEDKRNTIIYEDFELMYIPRKILEIKKPTGEMMKNGKEWIKTVYIQDVLGFFQCSFLNALKKWEIPAPEILLRGKEAREDFSGWDIKEVIKYNEAELSLLVELMEKLRAADQQACELIGIPPTHTPRSWYGPGARAANFLNQTDWVKEHPPFAGKVWDEILKRTEGVNFFASAYFGGRIEAAYKGEILQDLYDYDIASAYPFALSLFPRWEPEDLIRIKSKKGKEDNYDKEDRIGIYYVRWAISEQVGFYPFPFRSASKNVFFPATGEGWYMSPEVSAALAVYGPEQVKVYGGYVLAGTEGAGSGTSRLPEEKLCTTARLMARMAEVRLKAKAEKMSAEKALKLVMNSCYGKTIQQVGSTKHLNVFAASWITSVCRAMLVRAIGKDLGKNVISIMTDGVLTKKKLEVNEGTGLGEWEMKECRRVVQFLPGIYKMEMKSGEVLERYRGMSKDFSPEQALQALTSEAPWVIEMRVFVTRRLALHMPAKFEGKRYLFVPVVKEEMFSLASKRQDEVKTLEEYREKEQLELKKIREEDQKQFRRAVMALGGISDPAYEDIPRWAKRKKGSRLDVMVAELAEAGYYYESANGLYDALLEGTGGETAVKKVKRPGFVLGWEEKCKYYPPKAQSFADSLSKSTAYVLKGDSAVKPYDTATTMEELVGGDRIGSILDGEDV
ncbi:MAG TPA: DNA polymerase [Dehalococcoidales bacterium]|nr:DNA polymerase [Dehalococcoidales bacterium]